MSVKPILPIFVLTQSEHSSRGVRVNLRAVLGRSSCLGTIGGNQSRTHQVGGLVTGFDRLIWIKLLDPGFICLTIKACYPAD